MSDRLRVAILGKFVYTEPLEEMVARGFETIGCEVFRDQGIVGGVDLTVAIKCDWLPPEQMSGKRVLWWTDLTSRFPAFHKLAPDFDLAYTIHDEHIPLPPSKASVSILDGYKTEYPYLPCAYDPKFHHRVPGRKVWDFSFIGTHRPEREWIRTVFSGLQQNGYSVGIWGNGWGPTDKLVAPAVYGHTRNSIASRSKVVLNWMFNDGKNRDSMNMAFFQYLASGAFVASNVWGQIDLGFRAWEHYWPLGPLPTSDDLEECLKHPIQRWLVSRNGQAAVRGHTYAARCARILRDVGLR